MENEIPTLQWTQTYSCGHSQTLETQYAPMSLLRKDEVPREGLLENLVGGKCCGRGLGLQMPWPDIPKQGCQKWARAASSARGRNMLLLWTGTEHFLWVMSCKVFTCLLLLFDRRTTQGMRFRQLSEFGMFLKKTWEVWDNFLFSESGTKIIYRL